jgi:hypothetical protein
MEQTEADRWLTGVVRRAATRAAEIGQLTAQLGAEPAHLIGLYASALSDQLRELDKSADD